MKDREPSSYRNASVSKKENNIISHLYHRPQILYIDGSTKNTLNV